ncbi:hypothetical protein HDV05_006230, partial [Chytridiales sp. JEL 0842]
MSSSIQSQDDFLCQLLSSYFSTALYAGDAAMMISSPGNLHKVQLLLEAEGINIGWTIKTSQLTMIDGYSSMSELTAGGLDTAEIFEQMFCNPINDLLLKWPGLCVYGDLLSSMVFQSMNLNSSSHLADLAIEFEIIYHKFQTDKPNLIFICGYWMGAFTSGEFAADSSFVEKFRSICQLHDHAGTEQNPVWDAPFELDVVKHAEEQANDSGTVLSRLQKFSRVAPSHSHVTNDTIEDVPRIVPDITSYIISPSTPKFSRQREESLQAELTAFKIKAASFTDAMSILARSATESLKRERDVHNEILSALPFGVLCAESWREQQMFVNKTFCELVRCSEAEVMAGDWVQVVHPEDREKVRSLLMNMGEMSGHQKRVKLEYRILISKANSSNHTPRSAETASDDASTDKDTPQYNNAENDLTWVASETVKCNIKGRSVFVHAIIDTTELKRVNAERILLAARESYQIQRAADADRRRLLLDEFID